MRKPPEMIHSPDKKFILLIDGDGSVRKTVGLILYDSSYHKLSSFDTHASVYSKWAVGWATNDTIVISSRDIGVYALFISNTGNLNKSVSTQGIEQFADSIFKAKYQTD